MNKNKAKTFCIITFGCAMNYSDSDRIEAILVENGLVKTKKDIEADLVIINSCSVRQMAEDRTYGKISKLAKLKKRPRIVATGCLVSDKIWKKLLGKNKFDLCLPIDRMIDLPKYLEEWSLNKYQKSNIKYQTITNKMSSRTGRIRRGGDYPRSGISSVTENIKVENEIPDQVGDDTNKYKHYLDIVPKGKQSFSAYIPIMTGCNNFCSYCAVPYTRGREVSRPMADILEEARKLADSGCVDLTLLGQNVNSYINQKSKIKNQKTKNNFVELLKNISNIEKLKRIFFISSHPKDMSENLIKLVASRDNLCNYIHLPVQAGDNEILKKMNRHYTREQYFELVAKIRKIIPGVALTTDLIVGFPGETEEQFEQSVDLFKKCKFDMAFIAEYSPRPKTAAANLNDDVPKAEKHRRKKFLNDEVLAVTALENNQKLEGKILPVLISRTTKNGLIGLTEGLKQVHIKGDKKMIGQILPIKIVKAMAWALNGEIIPQ